MINLLLSFNTFVAISFLIPPAVYMTSNKSALNNSALFKNNDLRMQPADTGATPTTNTDSTHQFGPGSDGVTFELCAGIVDKQIPLEQIAKEEVLEETG